VRGPRAPVEAAPAPGAPPSEAAPTLAAPMPSIPQGEPLPPPSGPVTLQYRPTKGFIQTARITFSAKMMTEAKGQFMPQRATVRGRLHTVVEGVGADGMARLTLSLSDVDEDAGGAPYRLADIGLPEPGETLRLSVSRLNKVLQVEGKRLGTMSYFAIPFHLPYPETPTGIGGSWQFEQPANIELDGKKETATVRCTLMGRERFRSEETYRIGCESTASTPPGKILRGHQSGEIAAVVRARDGTLMYTEISIRLLIEGLGTKLSGDTHIVFEVEAPSAPAQAAAPGGPSAPAAPSTEPGKRP
jgi:hypothetical protein